MVIELDKINLKVEQEKPLKVYYDNQVIGDFYVDLLAEDEIVIELKSIETLTKAHACPVRFLPRLSERCVDPAIGAPLNSRQ